MPRNTAGLLVEGEFNRLYIRSVCRATIDNDGPKASAKVYRTKHVSNPRIESSGKIGSEIDAEALLVDLRTNIGTNLISEVTSGANSGLSVSLQ